MSKSLLVVEDNSDLRTMYSMFFRRQGYAVRTAGTGEEALGLLSQELSSLVILDLSLPVMSGEEFVLQLRADPALAATKILVTSGRDNLKQIAAQLGADDWALKPADLSALSEKIARLL